MAEVEVKAERSEVPNVCEEILEAKAQVMIKAERSEVPNVCEGSLEAKAQVKIKIKIKNKESRG